ncbi:AAA family ATPase [Streptomyces sp. SID11385]|uniref:AAA family ATPase n=1 Tax=Streptomyces sp. SID11385 TaxID=2706031 RepID=UPI0013C947A4|nr:AAA family ATPase [Streptomyces sp. SID11385]
MYITRVQLDGIKGFSGARAVDLRLAGRGGWTVLAGRNGAGKSTLLQAVALVLGGPGVARALVPSIAGWVSGGASTGEVTVEAGPKPKEKSSLRVLLWRNPDRTNPQDAEALHWQGATETSWPGHSNAWFYAGYGPFRRLSGGSSEAQRLMTAQGPGNRLATLFHEDASLAEGVSWLIDLRLRSYEEDPERGESRRLLDQVLTLLGDGLLPDRYQIQRVTADGLWVREAGDDGPGFPLREMSDGYRTVAALVLDLVRQLHATHGPLRTEATPSGGIALTHPGVVLIDEVDAHLHVTWQRRISGWLREHFPHIQFIVTSHSPYICQAADEGGLIRLPGPEEQAPPAVVDEDLYRRVVYGSGDDAVLSELFGLETPYSTRAEERRRRLVALERKVYAETATAGEIAEYQELSDLLTSSLESRVAEVSARLEGEPER